MWGGLVWTVSSFHSRAGEVLQRDETELPQLRSRVSKRRQVAGGDAELHGGNVDAAAGGALGCGEVEQGSETLWLRNSVPCRYRPK